MRECMNGLMPFSLVTFILIMVVSVNARQASDTFSASVAVSSEKSAEYKRAATEALIQVLSKSSGKKETEISANSALATDLKQASRWVAEYRYDTIKRYQGDNQLMLKLSFPEKFVINLMRIGRLPYWPQNRPQPLLFVVGQDQGKLELFNDNPDFRVLLNNLGDKYGLVPIYPSHYVAKRVSLQRLWALDSMRIQLATEGLSQDAVLVVRLKSLAFNTIEADWLFIDGDLEKSGSQMSPSPEAAMDSVYAWLVGQWAKHQTIDLTSHHNEFMLSVSNIRSYEDSTKLVAYLEGLREVSSVFVADMHAQGISVAVSLNTDWDKFLAVLHRSGQLSPELNQKDSYMHYFWWKE